MVTVIRINDNGIGLPEDFQMDKSGSFGLEIVNILTSQLKGKIDYHSDNGTEFALHFSIQ